MDRELLFGEMRLRFLESDRGEWKLRRFEPKSAVFREARMAAFEPFILKTASSTASPMEGCESIPSVWDGSRCEVVEQSDRRLVLKYAVQEGALEVTVSLEWAVDANVIRQINTVKNVGTNPVTLTHFSSGMICGIAMGGELSRWDENKIRVHTCKSHWCGEAQWREASLEDVGIYRQSMHNWDMSSYRISSSGTWSTGAYYPLMMVEDLECGEIWYAEHEGASNWSM